ncbi:hypothetical protein [Hyphomicrobium sp.]|uniref:hypothetical protein n=1 Tax=Hyphomicrobium sp. TaxID=82 RepID=UPI002D79224D|nr:hypothetical protein [Hyphomicrobium sp.]HET6390116.1 hypothetical protein [Hyphomicrobium sp.]
MSDQIEGIYAAYMTGSTGQGFAMFVIRDGLILGADPLGVTFDGTYVPTGRGDHSGKINVRVPPNGSTIQGVSVGPHGLTYDVTVSLPNSITDQDIVQLGTPLGPVNVRLNKLRGV